MIRRDLDEIAEEDLNRLIRNGRKENKRLEFKALLDLDGQQKHKHHLVQEVSGFANEEGGDLVVGIGEGSDGEAEKLIGMDLSSVDDTKERWGNILRDNIEPPIPSNLLDMEDVEFQNVNGKDRHGIIVRTEASWRAPHRETLTHRFYGRSPNGKQELDMGEIRDQFLETERFTERIKSFRDERIEAIKQHEGAMPVKGSMFVLHLIPANAFTRGAVLDPKAADRTRDNIDIHPQLLSNYPRGKYTRYNTDGYLMAAGVDLDVSVWAKRYVQTFRSGPIESVTDYGFVPNTEESRFDYSYIFTEDLRSQFKERLSEYIEFLSEQDARYPYVAFLTVLSAEDFYVAPNGRNAGYSEHNVINSEDARFPEVMIESPSDDIEGVVSDMMDYLYQAAGHSGEPASQKE
jgi:hypothetical protein